MVRLSRLGDFGSFRMTIPSDGAETAGAFNKDLIKSIKLNVRPGKLIRNNLKTADYEKVV